MFKNKNRYFWLLLALITLAPVPNIYAQEGSSNWKGTVTNRETSLAVPADNTGETGYGYRGYMMLPSNTSGYKPSHRLYVYVQEGETVYFSFRTASTTSTVNWYYDPSPSGEENRFPEGTNAQARTKVSGSDFDISGRRNGSGDFITYPLTSNATNNTNVQNRLNVGPAEIRGADGYTTTGSGTTSWGGQFTNNTGAARAFWVEMGSYNFQILDWDITVATSAGVQRPGRVYCKNWSIYNQLPADNTNVTPTSTSYHDNFQFFVPIDNTETGGYFVKSINFGGSNAGYAVYFANNTGPRSTGTVAENRRSLSTTNPNAAEFAGPMYPLFLTDPDPDLWPSSKMPATLVKVDFVRHPVRGSGALATLTVDVEYSGLVDILVDINSNGINDGTDVVISEQLTAGVHTIEWDGLDGDDIEVPNGQNINFITSVSYFPVHFPVFDMEQSAGMSFMNIRPLPDGVTGPQPEILYWDHSGITGATTPSDSWSHMNTSTQPQAMINTTGVQSTGTNRRNRWYGTGNNGFGNNRIINTWTGASNISLVRNVDLNWLEADLEIRKTVNDDEPFVGEVVDFTIVVKNNGISYASNVVMEDELQNNLEYVEHSITPSNKGIATYDNATKKVQWNIGLIEPLDSVIMTLRAKILAAGTNTATVSNSGVEPDPDPNNNSASVGVAIRNTTVAVDDFVETDQNEPVTGNVLTNDYDLEGDTQTVTNISVGTTGAQQPVSAGGTTITTDEGTLVIRSNGEYTFTPAENFSGRVEFQYTITDGGGATDTAILTIDVGICWVDVDGGDFQWRHSGGSGMVSESVEQPASSYGFVFDIYELDNSFNMIINGTPIAVDELEFQSDGTSGINVAFADGDRYEDDTDGKIWEMEGTPANPLIRVMISPTGSVSLYGSKTSGGELFPLVLIGGNRFNRIETWNETGTNTIVVTQNRVGVTLMDGRGYGRNRIPCVNYWMGGTLGEENTWSVPENWTDNKVPAVRQDVEFATVDNYGEAATHDLHLDDLDDDGSGGRIIGNLINNSDKNLVITTGNQLTINGKVEEKTDQSSTGTIVVKASRDESSGTLLFTDPSENEKVGAIVEFYNKAYDCEDCGFYTRSWQYFGIPVAESGTTPAPLPFTSVEEVNEWSEPEQSADKWVDPDMPLTAFTGYQITRNEQTEPDQDNAIHNFVGTLNVGDATVTLTKTDNVGYSGVNLVGNSYTAAIPINTTALDFQPAVQQTVYLFNTGTRDQWRKLNGSSVSGLNAGRYLSVPVNLAGVEELPGMIPSMHAFMLLTEQTAYLTIRYNQLVRNELVEDVNGNMISTRSAGATGTTGKATAASTIPSLKMDVIGEQSADRVWIFTKEGTTYGFDNGWDGRKMAESGITQLYVMDDAEKDRFQVATVPGLDNVTLGFVADTDGKYTVEFALSDHWTTEEIYLNDLATGTQTRVVNGGSYSFEAKKGDSGLRFHFSSSGNIPVDGEAARITVISTDDGNIAINNKSDNDCTVFISNTAGILLQKLEVEAGGEQVVEDVSGGTYVVRLQNAVVNDARRIVVR